MLSQDIVLKKLTWNLDIIQKELKEGLTKIKELFSCCAIMEFGGN